MRLRTDARALRALTCLLLVLLAPMPARAEPVSFTDDFEGEAVLAWSNSSIGTTPTGRRFLGPFGPETVSLSLGTFSAPRSVSLSFELFVLESWDGSGTFCCGPDTFAVEAGGTTLLPPSTFSNTGDAGNYQSYPAPYPDALYPARTGAAESNTLGYPTWGDSVYQFSFAFDHDGGPLTVKFIGAPNQPESDEMWGLDNVTVLVENESPVAANDVVELDEDSAIGIDVRANDVDADHDELAVTLATAPAFGTAEVVAGRIRYTPDPDWYGRDALSYTVSDGWASSTADVLIHVHPAVDPVRLVAEPAVGHIDGATPSADAHLPEGVATLTWEETGAPLEGRTIAFSAGGTPLCEATTDRSGRASCAFDLTHLPALLTADGYEATFAGAPDHFTPGSARAPVIAIE